jgi:hypothetical protein
LDVFAELFRKKTRIDATFSPATYTVSHCNQPITSSVGIFTSFITLIVMRNVADTTSENHIPCLRSGDEFRKSLLGYFWLAFPKEEV